MEDTTTEKTEFMRKSRFISLRDKFKDISEDAKVVIDKAKPEDILRLSLTFNSPVKVIEAEVFDESKFIDLAF